MQRKAGLLVLVCAAALAAAVTGTAGRLPAATAGALSAGGTGLHHPRPQESEETLQLTVTDGGFEPAQVNRRPGKFLLTADDRRGDKSQRLTLRLSREDGGQVRDIEVPREATDWAEEMDLPAGKYVLAVVGRPDWTCRIEFIER
jgi:hypothetical protein